MFRQRQCTARWASSDILAAKKPLFFAEQNQRIKKAIEVWHPFKASEELSLPCNMNEIYEPIHVLSFQNEFSFCSNLEGKLKATGRTVRMDVGP